MIYITDYIQIDIRISTLSVCVYLYDFDIHNTPVHLHIYMTLIYSHMYVCVIDSKAQVTPSHLYSKS